MSVLTKQRLLQARSDREDVLHRISVGEDTSVVRDRLSGCTKRVEQLEAQILSEQRAAKAKQQVHEEASVKKNDTKPSAYKERHSSQARPPRLEDIMMACGDCSSPFIFTGRDQAFFTKNGWPQPSRCPDCREAKKSAKPKQRMTTRA